MLKKGHDAGRLYRKTTSRPLGVSLARNIKGRTMKLKLKPLETQIVVVTGATSGIGLVTARMAARRGARLVLAARSEDALGELAEEINGAGGQAVYVVANVADEAHVRGIGTKAVERFGGLDTWVSNPNIGLWTLTR